MEKRKRLCKRFPTSIRLVMLKSLMLGFAILHSISFAAQTSEEIDGVIYDVVNVTVNTTSYDASKPPVFARVKYNKRCPLVLTSDDMGMRDLVIGWAFFNGYPAFDSNTYLYISRADDFLNTPYNTMEWYQQKKNIKRDSQQPLTYSDGTGGVRRFTATCAIWPYEVESTNTSRINGQDAKTMMRMGWSFAQHDVDANYTTNAETIASRFKALSDQWEEVVGVGLKVMIEPNGNHKYIDAGKMSDEICWNIFQNGELPNYPIMKPVRIDDWTSGTDWTTFDNKPAETTVRFFFQDKEAEFANMIEQADGSAMILGGTHGMSDAILTYLKETVQPSDQMWVTGADEVWEYYHLYNNALITDVSYNSGELTFNVKIPRYKKHQFRELTINIPGVSDGTSHTFSNNVITGSGRQNTDYYTINLGLEDKIHSYIEELIAYYRSHQHNSYVKNDAQYLINLLAPGEAKNDYQAQLDAAPAYCTYEVKTDIGEKTLAFGAQDEATAVTYAYPKYLLDGTDLYETSPNATIPYFVSTYTPESGTDSRTVTYTKAVENVVFFCEGEDLDGASYAPVNTKKVTSSNEAEYYTYRWSSNAAGGIIRQPVTLLTLQPGKYKLTVAAAGTNEKTSSITTYQFKLGENAIYTLQSDKKNMFVYEKEEIIVKEEQTLTLEAENPNVTRWIDYLYIQKTGDYDVNSPDVVLTSPSYTYDITEGIPPITITATSSPKVDGATVTHTVIRDDKGDIIAENDGATCTFSLVPTRLGTYQFVAEATDDTGRTGISDRISVIITSDIVFTAMSNLGDEIYHINMSSQTEDVNLTYMYPRYILKGTDLYETSARNEANQPRYGENLTLSLADRVMEKTVDYEMFKPNVIFYQEGEDISGATRVTQDYGKSISAEYYALMLGSNGVAGRFSNVDVTTLPPGRYRLYAGIGKTATSKVGDITFYFKLDGTTFYEYIAPSYPNIFDISSEFEVTTEESTLSVAISQNGVKDWLDYLYIQKLDDVPVRVTAAGYATFSSPYALDFTNSTVKAYTATVDGDKVNMTRQSGTVPAATGLFLQGIVGEDVHVNVPLATEPPEAIIGNALKAHLTDGLVEAGNYVFSGTSDGNRLAFRRLSSDTNIPAGRSYLSIPADAPAHITFTLDDESTSVGSLIVDTTDDASPLYNLMGVKISPSAKGVVIKNGKKHMKR